MPRKTAKKTYSLDKKEKEHLSAIKGMWTYLQQVIQADMSRYVESVVKPRLGVSDEYHLLVDIEKGEVVVEKNEAPATTGDEQKQS